MATTTRKTERDDTEPAVDLYQGYEMWKGWTKFFTYTPEQSMYFAGECRDAKIKGGDVFEIGFGSGSFLSWARDSQARVAGCEINPTLLKAARDFGLELLPADFETVSTTHNECFDTIVAFDVFEHLTASEVTKRVHAADRMLRLGGHLLLRFPNAQSPFGLPSQNGDPTHKSALSRNIFEQHIQGTSFEVVPLLAVI